MRRLAPVLTLFFLAPLVAEYLLGEMPIITEATVKTHINRLFAKTGVRDRAQAVAYAYRQGLAG
jgi:predicted transcriptional regulator